MIRTVTEDPAGLSKGVERVKFILTEVKTAGHNISMCHGVIMPIPTKNC